MPADVFFDTTVLVYVATEDDDRAAVAEKLLRAGGIVSVQVLNEFVAVARRKMRMRWEPIEELLSALRELCGEPVPTTAELHGAALQIAKRYGFMTR